MTTKQASDTFCIPVRTIRDLCRQNKIADVVKNGREYIIPDDTPVIITDDKAKAFLLQLLKFKNNPDIVLSQCGIDSEQKGRTFLRYLLSQNLIGECDYCDDYRQLLRNMQITDHGFDFLLGSIAKEPKSININIEVSNNVNNNANIGLISAGLNAT